MRNSWIEILEFLAEIADDSTFREAKNGQQRDANVKLETEI